MYATDSMSRQEQPSADGFYAVHGEKIRYLAAGVFNTVFGYALFLVMLVAFGAFRRLIPRLPTYAFDNYFLLAHWLAWALSVPVATMSMKYFAFRSAGSLLHEIRRSYLVYLPATLLNSGVLWLAVQRLGLIPAVGQLLAIAVSVLFSYLGHKHFTFRAKSPAPQSP